MIMAVLKTSIICDEVALTDVKNGVPTIKTFKIKSQIDIYELSLVVARGKKYAVISTQNQIVIVNRVSQKFCNILLM